MSDELVELTATEPGVVYVDVSRLFVDVTVEGDVTEVQAGEIRARVLDALQRANRGSGPTCMVHDESVRIAFYQAR